MKYRYRYIKYIGIASGKGITKQIAVCTLFLLLSSIIINIGDHTDRGGWGVAGGGILRSLLSILVVTLINIQFI